jgi:hypothetical protein
LEYMYYVFKGIMWRETGKHQFILRLLQWVQRVIFLMDFWAYRINFAPN